MRRCREDWVSSSPGTCGHTNVYLRSFPSVERKFSTRRANCVSAADLCRYAVEAVDDGGVVTAAESISDFDELHGQQLATEKHGDLARRRERLRAGLGFEPIGSHTPFPGGGVLNCLDSQADAPFSVAAAGAAHRRPRRAACLAAPRLATWTVIARWPSEA